MIFSQVKIAAKPEEHSTRGDGSKAIVSQAIIRVSEVLDAIRFAEEFSAVKGINEYFGRARLMAANEVSRQADARNRQA